MSVESTGQNKEPKGTGVPRAGRHGGTRLARTHRSGQSTRDPFENAS